jgi:hypothetical protein
VPCRYPDGTTESFAIVGWVSSFKLQAFSS